MSSLPLPRVPAGTPTGGQFAAHQSSEAPITLVAPAAEPVWGDDLDAHDVAIMLVEERAPQWAHTEAHVWLALTGAQSAALAADTEEQAIAILDESLTEFLDEKDLA